MAIMLSRKQAEHFDEMGGMEGLTAMMTTELQRRLPKLKARGQKRHKPYRPKSRLQPLQQPARCPKCRHALLCCECMPVALDVEPVEEVAA